MKTFYISLCVCEICKSDVCFHRKHMSVQSATRQALSRHLGPLATKSEYTNLNPIHQVWIAVERVGVLYVLSVIVLSGIIIYSFLFHRKKNTKCSIYWEKGVQRIILIWAQVEAGERMKHANHVHPENRTEFPSSS